MSTPSEAGTFSKAKMSERVYNSVKDYVKKEFNN